MKILYVANMRLPTEKAHGVQIMKTCEALSRAGAEVELVVSSRHTAIKASPFAYYGVEENFVITRVPVLDCVSMGRIGFLLESVSFSISALARVLREKGIVYSRDELPLFVFSFFKKHIAWESHAGRDSFLTRRLLRLQTKVVVITHGLEAWYKAKVPQASIHVAPDAIDLAAFAHPEPTEAARTRLGLPLDKKIALYIGRLDGWKGVSTFLEASRLLDGAVQCVVIGGEPEQVARLSHTYPTVRFVGFRPYTELADNQAAADVLVLPNTAKDIVSAQFTSPMKLFTYMAAQKPIVASDLPSLREVLNEQNAVFCKADDAQSLAGAITRVLGDPIQAQRIADAARRDVMRYTWEARAQSILTFLEN